MPSSRTLTKQLVSTFVVLAIGYFFYRAAARNWASIRAHELGVAPFYLALALLLLALGYTLSTYAWHLSVNSLAAPAQLAFRESFAFVNASGFTKYVPGKVWSYALQMHWLGQRGFSRSLVVYVNLLNACISSATALLVGFALLACTSRHVALAWALGALCATLALDLASVRYHTHLFEFLRRLILKSSGRTLAPFAVSRRLLWSLHALHAAYALLAAGVSLLAALGTGFSLTPRDAGIVACASLLGDVVGFAAVFVPGGLGVREGAMFFLLGNLAHGALAVVLPIVTRSLILSLDFLFGVCAFALSATLKPRIP